MANEIPTMSLKQATFNLGSFTPFIYTPQVEDIGLLQKSLAQREARLTSAAEQQAKFNETAAKLQTLVNPEEEQWVYDYIKRQRKGFENSIESADYGETIRLAKIAGSTLFSTPEAIGRIRAQEEYQQEVKTQQERRNKGEISQNTYVWWLASNPYKYEDTYDKNGNIIGGSSFVAKSRPVADINWAAQAQVAFKMITPYKNTKGDSTAKSSSRVGTEVGKNIVDEGYSLSYSSGGTHSIERITKEEILNNIEKLLSSTPDGYRQAEQAYDVAKFEFTNMQKELEGLIKKNANIDEIQDLTQKIEKRKELMYKNGSPISYKEYYARMVTDNAYANGLAYEWRTDNTQVSESENGSSIGGEKRETSLTYKPGYTYDSKSGLWYGPLVRQKTNTESTQKGAADASKNVTERFKDNKK